MVDYLFIGLLAVTAVGAVVSFAAIEKYLLAHKLMKREDPFPNVLEIYRKYARHTREQTGRSGPWFGIHVAFAGVFILLGVAYTLMLLGAYLF